MIRAFFLDGPDHGTTRMFEAKPPLVWRTMGEIARQHIMAEPLEHMHLGHIHRYVHTYATRKGVWLYEYEGIEQ